MFSQNISYQKPRVLDFRSASAEQRTPDDTKRFRLCDLRRLRLQPARRFLDGKKGKTIYESMMLRGSPILGNLHVCVCVCVYIYTYTYIYIYIYVILILYYTYFILYNITYYILSTIYKILCIIHTIQIV